MNDDAGQIIRQQEEDCREGGKVLDIFIRRGFIEITGDTPTIWETISKERKKK